MRRTVVNLLQMSTRLRRDQGSNVERRQQDTLFECQCILLELERDGSLSLRDRRSWRDRLSAKVSCEELRVLRLELHRLYALG